MSGKAVQQPRRRPPPRLGDCTRCAHIADAATIGRPLRAKIFLGWPSRDAICRRQITRLPTFSRARLIPECSWPAGSAEESRRRAGRAAVEPLLTMLYRAKTARVL